MLPWQKENGLAATATKCELPFDWAVYTQRHTHAHTHVQDRWLRDTRFDRSKPVWVPCLILSAAPLILRKHTPPCTSPTPLLVGRTKRPKKKLQKSQQLVGAFHRIKCHFAPAAAQLVKLTALSLCSMWARISQEETVPAPAGRQREHGPGQQRHAPHRPHPVHRSHPGHHLLPKPAQHTPPLTPIHTTPLPRQVFLIPLPFIPSTALLPHTHLLQLEKACQWFTGSYKLKVSVLPHSYNSKL